MIPHCSSDYISLIIDDVEHLFMCVCVCVCVCFHLYAFLGGMSI